MCIGFRCYILKRHRMVNSGETASFNGEGQFWPSNRTKPCATNFWHRCIGAMVKVDIGTGKRTKERGLFQFKKSICCYLQCKSSLKILNSRCTTYFRWWHRRELHIFNVLWCYKRHGGYKEMLCLPDVLNSSILDVFQNDPYPGRLCFKMILIRLCFKMILIRCFKMIRVPIFNMLAWIGISTVSQSDRPMAIQIGLW